MGKLKQIVFNPITALILTVVSLLVVLSLRQNLRRLDYSRENLRQSKDQVEQLEETVSEKRFALDKAKQPLSKEKILRDELLLKRPGEFVVQLPEIVIENEGEVDALNQPPWEEWKQVLFDDGERL